MVTNLIASASQSASKLLSNSYSYFVHVHGKHWKFEDMVRKATIHSMCKCSQSLGTCIIINFAGLTTHILILTTCPDNDSLHKFQSLTDWEHKCTCVIFVVKLYGFCLSIARRRHPYIESLPTLWYNYCVYRFWFLLHERGLGTRLLIY